MNLLLLQGPQGPFFHRLQRECLRRGYQCWRVALNGGDKIGQIPEYSLEFNQPFESWKTWLEKVCCEKGICHLLVYGDCRDYHRIAKEVCDSLNIAFYVLEEGYIRPNYVTLEKEGVNAFSTVTANQVANWSIQPWPRVKTIRFGFYSWAWHAIVYYNAMMIRRNTFPHYRHHRESSAAYNAFCHLRSLVRKSCYALTQPHQWSRLKKETFFLVPLQVSYDAQVHRHSGYPSIAAFLREVIASFASHAPADTILVCKHHPLDRGFIHYGKVLRELSKTFQVEGRVIYVHDLHMPKLLKMAKGVVTINSTTAVSAYHHETPVKILGRAFYNIPPLADQQPLEEFWAAPRIPDHDFYLKLRNYLEYHNQIPGNFYSQSKSTAKKVLDRLMRS